MGFNKASDFDESECVELINRGDESAFERLFANYYAKLCRFVYRYVKSEAIAESLVQEVFVRVWEQREQLDPTRNIRSFLYQSVRNEALDYIEHKNIVKEKLSLLKITQETVTLPGEESFDKQKFWSFVQNQIENLPSKTRIIYKLSRKDGLTYDEIAEVLDISSKTVEYHISKALDLLRQQVKYSYSSLHT